jgi:hypothetical protein
MRHTKNITRIPARAQGTGATPAAGLCTNIVSDTQARFCFVLAFLTDVFVPLIQPFVSLKTTTTSDSGTSS